MKTYWTHTREMQLARLYLLLLEEKTRVLDSLLAFHEARIESPIELVRKTRKLMRLERQVGRRLRLRPLFVDEVSLTTCAGVLADALS